MSDSSTVTYDVIGTIRSDVEAAGGGPIQPTYADGTTGRVSVREEYADGLADLDAFSHVILVYHCHAVADGYDLAVEPFLDERERGVFATRAPRRPNSVGLSVVRLDGIEGRHLSVREIDVVDGTPLLDLKPYVPAFDGRDGTTRWISPPEDPPAADDRFL